MRRFILFLAVLLIVRIAVIFKQSFKHFSKLWRLLFVITIFLRIFRKQLSPVIPFRMINLQTLIQKLFGFKTQVFSDFHLRNFGDLWNIYVLLEHFYNLLLTNSTPRQLSVQQLIKYATKTPDIVFICVFFSFSNLKRHIKLCSCISLIGNVLFTHFWDSKVSDF